MVRFAACCNDSFILHFDNFDRRSDVCFSTVWCVLFHIHKFLLSYEDIEKVYDSIEALMSDKIYNGKSLSEIAPLLTLL